MCLWSQYDKLKTVLYDCHWLLKNLIYWNMTITTIWFDLIYAYYNSGQSGWHRQNVGSRKKSIQGSQQGPEYGTLQCNKNRVSLTYAPPYILVLIFSILHYDTKGDVIEYHNVPRFTICHSDGPYAIPRRNFRINVFNITYDDFTN